MISPSATSPALSTIADNGYFFRTAPSDARQGQVLAEITIERGINEVAVTKRKWFLSCRPRFFAATFPFFVSRPLVDRAELSALAPMPSTSSSPR